MAYEFSIIHIDGTMEQPGDGPDFSELLDELAHADLEHGNVAVEHESGWGLLVLQSGRVIWENVEDWTSHRDILMDWRAARSWS